MLSRKEIENIFKAEGFLPRYLDKFEIEEGITDPITEKKSAWVVSWKLDNDHRCEYIEVTTAEQLTQALQSEKNQEALEATIAAYLESKLMEVNKFDQECVNASGETKGVVKALKKIGDVNSFSVQPDFYEPSMYCIVKGSEKINEESEYDDRCVAGSMEKDVALSIIVALGEAALAAKHVKNLASGGQKLVSAHKEIVKKHTELEDEFAETKKKLTSVQNEVDSLKKRLDESFSNALIAEGGEGNVTVADPKKFAKLIRVIETLHEKIERAQSGEEVEGLPISSAGGTTNEVTYFKTMIELILGAVKG